MSFKQNLRLRESESRVYGLRGLMVVDASIMPFVPSAPTNLTTIMIAEQRTSREDGAKMVAGRVDT